jgi:hypothetical protein
VQKKKKRKEKKRISKRGGRGKVGMSSRIE